jgi:hypothetical protein
MPVPYLADPPAVIPIDIGRQLFVDDFLIESTTLVRRWHYPEPCPANPVLTFDREWEKIGAAPMAAPFSDGVWFDPQDSLFKLWYAAGYIQNTCYAVSRDGISWQKPQLDIEPGTNIVVHHDPESDGGDLRLRDSNTIWLSGDDPSSASRFKMFTTVPWSGKWRIDLLYSPDGLHWQGPIAHSGKVRDRTTVFYNPFRDVWVYSLRIRDKNVGRARAYRENQDVVKGLTDSISVLWTSADFLDPHHPDPPYASIAPELYNLDAVAYESLLLGLFSIWQGPQNAECDSLGIQKRNELLIGYSRDGFHWHRPDRNRFIAVNETEGAWDRGNIQSAGGGCLVVGDYLYFYYSGRSISQVFWDGNVATGMAVLRRDGFASLDAAGEEGVLTTRPLLFKGNHLFVNVAAREGELRVEILDEKGEVIEPFSKTACQPMQGDATLLPVTWESGGDLSSIAGKAVRFRFYVRNGSLYSFWVSPGTNGASHGYVAAGGPGFRGQRDEEGIGAYHP